MNQADLERNKAVIDHFDKACIEQKDEQILEELVADNVINHAAQQGTPNGKESFYHFLKLLHNGLTDIKVEKLQQIAEKDLVVTRKIISAVHSGNFMGVAPSNKSISFEAIEIIRLENGKYAEHWVQSNLSTLLFSLQSNEGQNVPSH